MRRGRGLSKTRRMDELSVDEVQEVLASIIENNKSREKKGLGIPLGVEISMMADMMED